jgi:chromatin segregation and condensation protein Rec8/ScpA/Scc1 (kleisin family)
MRISALLTISTVLFLLSQGAMAQTASDTPAGNTRELRRQDSEECLKLASEHNVLKRNQAEFVRTCMAERQGERRAAAKKEAVERRRQKRGMAAEEWEAIQKVRNQERREQLEKQTAKRAECNKQANEQKLRLKARRAFVMKCVAG